MLVAPPKHETLRVRLSVLFALSWRQAAARHATGTLSDEQWDRYQRRYILTWGGPPAGVKRDQTECCPAVRPERKAQEPDEEPAPLIVLVCRECSAALPIVFGERHPARCPVCGVEDPA